jgi:hypothetical protein
VYLLLERVFENKERNPYATLTMAKLRRVIERHGEGEASETDFLGTNPRLIAGYRRLCHTTCLAVVKVRLLRDVCKRKSQKQKQKQCGSVCDAVIVGTPHTPSAQTRS